jgi:hypothetical protein
VTAGLAIVLLALAAAQLGVLFAAGWSGDPGDVFQLVLAAVQLLVAGLRAGRAQSPLADDPPPDARTD